MFTSQSVSQTCYGIDFLEEIFLKVACGFSPKLLSVFVNKVINNYDYRYVVVGHAGMADLLWTF